MCWVDHVIKDSWNSSDVKYLALSLISLSEAPMSQNTEFKALTISVVCRLFNCHSKMQQE